MSNRHAARSDLSLNDHLYIAILASIMPYTAEDGHEYMTDAEMANAAGLMTIADSDTEPTLRNCGLACYIPSLVVSCLVSEPKSLQG